VYAGPWLVGAELMPYKPRRPCSGRGPRRGACPNLIRGSETCCPECMPFEKKATRRYDKARDESPGRKFLHSAVWRRIRAAKLNRDALCERCQENGIITAAFLVHHIDEDQQNNNNENLLSCCQSCHELIHRKDRYGR